MVHNPLLSQLIAGFGLFIVSLIGLDDPDRPDRARGERQGLAPIDRTLGLLFGVARGAVLVSLAYLLLDLSVPPTDRPLWIRDAKSTPYLREGADTLRSFLPESLKTKGDELLRKAGPNGTAAEQAKQAMDALTKPTPPAAKPDSPPPPPATRRPTGRSSIR